MAEQADQVLKTLIVGSGPAGLTAGIYAARAALKPVLLAGATPGGQLTKTTDVENFPGFAKGIDGPKLMEEMLEQARNCGTEVLSESVSKIEAGERPFVVTTDAGKVFKTHTIIYATGASPRMLGLEGEKKYWPPQGSGVTTCAVCDGNFYRNVPVVVVGGGDSAMEEATYLSNICSKVTIVHRREGLRASQVMIERARAKENIEWELNQVIEEILGDDKTKQVTGVRLKNTQDGSTKELQVEGVFIAIGHIPATEVLKDVVDLDEESYIKTNDAQETSIKGFYAAGDCHDRRYRQAITAAAMGCKAALEVERFLTLEGIN